MRKRSGHSFKFYLSLIRHPGTPESIGRGVAIGFFTAFIIPAGHMLTAFLLAIPARGARGIAVLATWIVNPLNMPVVYPAQCYLGSFIIGHPLSYTLIRQLVLDAFQHPSLKTVSALGGELVASFLAGGVLLGAVAALTGYLCTTEIVRSYRARRAKKKELWANRRKIEECG